MELPRHLPMAPFPPGLTGSLPSPQVWVPPWLAQLSQPSQAPEKDRLHDVSRDLGLFNKPCRQSTQLAYGSRLLMLHHIHIKRKTLCATKLLCHGLLENRVSNRMVPGTPKYNGLQSLLPFWTIPQYQTHPRRASAFGSSLAGSSFSAVSGACQT